MQQRSGGILFETCTVVAATASPSTTQVGTYDQVCFSMCGGPIATLVKSQISIFSGGASPSNRIATCILPNNKPVLGLYFLKDLSLVCVFVNGQIAIWDDFTVNKDLRIVCELGSPLILCTLHDSNNSLVILTSSLDLFLIQDLRSLCKHIRLATKLPLMQAPRCIAVLRPWKTNAAELEIAIGIPEQSGIIVVKRNGIVEARVPTQFKHDPSKVLLPHPNQDLLVSLDLADQLLITTLQFDRAIYVHRLDTVPRGVEWVMGGGAGFAVAVVWPSAVDVVGFLSSTQMSTAVTFPPPNGQQIISSYAEFDGVKLLGANGQLGFVRRVPQCTVSCFSANSTSTARALYRAVQAEFPSSVVQNHEQQQLDVFDLVAACHDLLDCTKFTNDYKQKLLLFKACQLGRSSIPSTCDLQVLAQLADKFVNLIRLAKAQQQLLPVGCSGATVLECLQLTLPVFASRMLYMGFALQVEQFSQAMGDSLQLDGQLAFWRSRQTPPSSSARTTCYSALGVLMNKAEICDKEERLSRRIIALLHVKDYSRVLHLLTTLRGVDFDLKSRVALRLYTNKLVDEHVLFANATCDYAIRSALKSSGSMVKLDKYLVQQCNVMKKHSSNERAFLLLEAAFKQQEDEGALDLAFVEEAGKEFEANSFYSAQTKDFAKLVAMQRENKLPIGKSVGDTLVHCFARNRDDVCEKLRVRFQIRPQIYARCRLHAFAIRNLFAEAIRAVLQNEFKFADAGITVGDVVDLAFQHSAHSALSRIAFDVLPQDSEDRARIFLRLKMYPEALRVAEETLCVDVMEEMAMLSKYKELQAKALLALDAVVAKRKQMEEEQQAGQRGVPVRCQTQ